MTQRRPTGRKKPTARKRPKPAAAPKTQIAALRKELAESQGREAALSKILHTIASAPGDAEQALNLIAATTAHIFDAAGVHIRRLEGKYLRSIGTAGPAADMLGAGTPDLSLDANIAPSICVRERRQVYIDDIDREGVPVPPSNIAIFRRANVRSFVATPLMREGEAIGAMMVHRTELRGFDAANLKLLESFADQAVIAIENARVLGELNESLENQTASANILRTIASTPADAQRSLDTIAETAARLFGASSVIIRRVEGEMMHFVGGAGPAGPLIRSVLPDVQRVTAETTPGAAILENRQLYVPDLERVGPEMANWVGMAASRKAGSRSVVATPLVREGRAIGAMTVHRDNLTPFTEEDLEQLRNFADQAVIAIENARLLSELRESLEFQTATSDVLRAISRSIFDVDLVLQSMLETAAQLCGAASDVLFRKDADGMFRFVTGYSLNPAYIEHERLTPIAPGNGTVIGRAALAGQTVQILDALNDEAYEQKDGARLTGIRSMIGVPLMRDGEMVGAIGLARTRVEAFTPRQIELVTTFADQAVIAIENARLLSELRESLDRQIATSEVLGTISSSPGELQPIFQTMIEKATLLCGAETGTLALYERDGLRGAAVFGHSDAYANVVTQIHHAPAGSGLARMEAAHRSIQIADVAQEPFYDAIRKMNPDFGRVRTALYVPIRKQDTLIGAFMVYRHEVRAFDAKQVELVESFAAQAVIAIENARLLTELRESLDRQTATAEVLRVISSSSGALEPVFASLLDNALRICDAGFGILTTYQDKRFHPACLRGVGPSFAQVVERFSPQPGRLTALGQIAETHRTVHFPDLMLTDAYLERDPLMVGSVQEGNRALLAVPMVRDAKLLGAIIIYRKEAAPFTDTQVEFIENFADQAVIAIENARLLTELRESLDRRTAIAEVLQAISSSPGDVQPVFETMLDRAVKLCEPADGAVFRVENDVLRTVAFTRVRDGVAPYSNELRASPGTALARMLETKAAVHVPDLGAALSNMEPESPVHAAALKAVEDGARSALWVPAVTNDEIVASFYLQRRELRPFADAEIGLVENFASQAVIAIENARLLEELRTARDEAERALGDLKLAQASLIQAEKMASLGQLTAGIAHEIKNPLNFVNNFAGLSVELLDELKEAQAQAVAALDADKRAEVDELIGTLTGNLAKIGEHGRRADGIVKSMLAHSRGGSGERQSVNLNALVEESLNLAYHGARAQDQTFNITMERELDAGLAPVEVVPQDLTRVFLNLIGNGFYAANKRLKEGRDPAFRPTLKVSTADLGAEVAIRIRDNGVGIPAEHRAKLFEPFFTTKPTGEGTGLGLSISYEIVTRTHGGRIAVDSEPGSFTEFTVTLPKRSGAKMAAENAKGDEVR